MAKRTPAPRWHAHLSFGVSVLIVTAAIWAAAQVLQASSATPIANASTGRVAVAASGDFMLESGPWVWSAPRGRVISGVTVTVGGKTRSFAADESSDCYAVKGIGTRTVQVSGGEPDGRCDPITNVVFNMVKS
jgi:hypothetical protein